MFARLRSVVRVHMATIHSARDATVQIQKHEVLSGSNAGGGIRLPRPVISYLKVVAWT